MFQRTTIFKGRKEIEKAEILGKEGKVFVCEVCQKVCTTKHSLKLHKKVHKK